MLRARRSASCLVSSSTWRITRADSWRSSSSSSRISSCLAWPGAEAGQPLQLAHLVAARLLELGRLVVHVALAVVQRLLAGVLGRLRARRRSSRRPSSARRACSSSSARPVGLRAARAPPHGRAPAPAPSRTPSPGPSARRGDRGAPGPAGPARARDPSRARLPRTLPRPPRPPGRSPSNPSSVRRTRRSCSSSSVRLGAVGLRLLAGGLLRARPSGARRVSGPSLCSFRARR